MSQCKNHFKQWISAGVLMLCAVFMGHAFGQTTTQGSITGTVFDTTGAVIPGAVVKMVNDGTNAVTTVTSDASGFYKAPLLEPGTYTVTFTAQGFGAYTADKVDVQVGQVTEVEPKLTAGSTNTVVQVSASAPLMNYESPDMSSNLNQAAVQGIPIQIRRWSALSLTTPGVTADYNGFGLISVRGMSTLLNNVLIDGADDNQAFFSEERGRSREAYSASPDAVREFEVNTGVYSAQYGRSAGAVINSVTNSGSNELHGNLFFQDIDRGFGAFDPGSVSPAGLPLKPKDLHKMYGFSGGGPLIKDKLFWYYTYDQSTHINPGIAKAKSYGTANTVGSFLEQPDATLVGGGTTACNTTYGYVSSTGNANQTLDDQVCTMAARLGMTYTNAATLYNADLAGLETDLGLVKRAGFQEINTPKVDWQINQKNRLSVLFHRLRWDAPGDVQTSTSATYSLDAWGNDFVKLDYGVTKLATQINSRLSNEVLYQYSRELDDEGQQTYTPYTLANLVATGGSSVIPGYTNAPSGGTVPYIALDTSIGFDLGSPYYSYRIKYPDERKWQVNDTLFYSLGNHTIRMGGDIVHNYDLLQQTPYYYGDYTYGSLFDYFTDLATKPTSYAADAAGSTGTCNSSGAAATANTTAGSGVGPYQCYTSVTQDFGTNAYGIATTDYAGFVQDNWKFRPTLTLELGLRYDYESIPAPTAALTTATGSFVPYAGLNNAPSDKHNFGPRIGFSWDVYGQGKTVLRGGYGLYYGRILNGTIGIEQFGSGSPNGQYGIASTAPATCTGSTCVATPGASNFPYPVAGGGGTKPSSFYLAPNLKNPQVDEFDLQLQQEVGKGTIFSVSYMGSLGRDEPNFLDVNLAPPEDTSTVTVVAPTTGASGPLPVGSTYTIPIFGTCTAGPSCPYPTGYINTNFSNITEVISNINSNYNGLVGEIQNRSIHNLQFDANYTWSHALDFNQNAQSTTTINNWLNPYASQRQNYGLSQFNVGNRFVGYVLYTLPGLKTNSPLKYLTNGWSVNETFQMQNGLPYSAEINTGKASSSALNTGTWTGAPSVYYIPPIGLNTYQVPRATVDDVRLQKVFVFGRYNLQMYIDTFNVANHQNYTTTDINDDAYNLAPTGATATMTFLPSTGPGVGFGSHSTSNDSGFLYTPREFLIAGRFSF